MFMFSVTDAGIETTAFNSENPIFSHVLDFQLVKIPYVLVLVLKIQIWLYVHVLILWKIKGFMSLLCYVLIKMRVFQQW